MTNQELMEEIKALRKDVASLSKEFYVFKGKAFGFISLLSVGFNLALNYFITKK